MGASTPIPTEGTRVYIRTIAGADIEILGHNSIGGLDGQRNEKDRTTLADSDEVIALGIRRFGVVNLNVFHADDDPGLDELEVAAEDGAKRVFTWVLPTGKYRQFQVYVKSFPFDNGTVDADYQGNIPLRVTGSVTKSTGFTPATVP